MKISRKGWTRSSCRYFAECGGCPLMCLSYEAQLRIKKQRVKDALERIGGFRAGEDYVLRDMLHTVQPGDDGTLSMPLRYRNKAEFAIQGSRIGYMKRGSHELFEIEDCLIQDEAATLADACLRIMNHPDLRQQLAVNGYEMVKQHYSWKEKIYGYVR